MRGRENRRVLPKFRLIIFISDVSVFKILNFTVVKNFLNAATSLRYYYNMSFTEITIILILTFMLSMFIKYLWIIQLL
jgi:ABC-type transport system involved in Fe-S cluster assembly fused permease/ATPase subunit